MADLVPTEILTKIFKIFVDDHLPCQSCILSPPPQTQQSATCKPLEPIFVLAAINQRWRSIALATHSLWSTLIADFEDPQNLVSVTSRLHIQAERSGRESLSLYLYGFLVDEEDEDGSGAWKLFLAFIRDHSPQWGRLLLHVPWCEDLFGNDEDATVFPNLYQLALYDYEGTDTSSTVISRHQFPRLREFGMKDLTIRMQNICWGRLAVLDVHVWSKADFMHVLKNSAKSAVHLRINYTNEGDDSEGDEDNEWEDEEGQDSGEENEEEDDEEGEGGEVNTNISSSGNSRLDSNAPLVIEFPSLETLDITSNDFETLGAALSHIKTPNVTQLRLISTSQKGSALVIKCSTHWGLYSRGHFQRFILGE